MAERTAPDKGDMNKPAEGWWEYGVGGYIYHATNKPVEPRWNPTRLMAEIEAARIERLYVVRRWVTPGVWEKVEPDDHPGVEDYEWSQYLEWRDKQLVKVGEEARERLFPVAGGSDE